MRSEIPLYVQEMVAGTNGNHYRHCIGKLRSLPIPSLPFWIRGKGYFLDLGSGWGRWCLAAAQKGFIPVGLDVKWEAAKTARDLLREKGFHGYAVVADLSHLPFANSTFSAVWSFSVLQHVHRARVETCLHEIQRVLGRGKFIFEIPLKSGVWNRLVRWRRGGDGEEDQPQSWCVRYYSLSEIISMVRKFFPQVEATAHCFFGIGILPIDLKFVRPLNKMVVVLSLMLTKMARILPPLSRFADSIYIRTEKQ